MTLEITNEELVILQGLVTAQIILLENNAAIKDDEMKTVEDVKVGIYYNQLNNLKEKLF